MVDGDPPVLVSVHANLQKDRPHVRGIKDHQKHQEEIMFLIVINLFCCHVVQGHLDTRSGKYNHLVKTE